MFQKIHTDNEKTVRYSFLIAQKIAQTMKPYSQGHFAKKCLTDVAEKMCPKMVQEFEKISLSRWTTATRPTLSLRVSQILPATRIDELAGNICDTLKDKVKNFLNN